MRAIVHTGTTAAAFAAGPSAQRLYRAGLALFATHATIVGASILAEHRFWFELLDAQLLPAAADPNDDEAGMPPPPPPPPDTQRLVFDAMLAIVRVVAHETGGDDGAATQLLPTPDALDALRYYQGQFAKRLHSPRALNLRLAMRGFGLLAAPIRRHLSAAPLTEALTLMLQRIAFALRTAASDTGPASADAHACATITAADEVTRTTLDQYPHFMRALAQIMPHISVLAQHDVQTLEQTLVQLMRQFCQLPDRCYAGTVHAMLVTFAQLASVDGAVQRAVMATCTQRAVVWTCAHRLPIDAQADWTERADWRDHITVEEFYPMWLGLMVEDYVDDAADEERPMEGAGIGTASAVVDTPAVRAVKRQMYEHFLDVLFQLLDRLDLGLQRAAPAAATQRASQSQSQPPPPPQSQFQSQGSVGSMAFIDPQRDLEARRPADFHLFHNLVQLCERVLPAQSEGAQREVFGALAGRYFECVGRLAGRHRLVSGAVRLMSVGLRIAGRVGLLEGGRVSAASVAVVQRFVAAQLRLARSAHGERQLASAMAVFAAPVRLLERGAGAGEVAAVYRGALAAGAGELRLARAALRSLEQLVQWGGAAAEADAERFVDRVLREVLPALDEYYLQAGGGVVGEVGETAATALTNQRQRNRSVLAVRRKRRVVQVMERGGETELVQFQKRVLMFLGE